LITSIKTMALAAAFASLAYRHPYAMATDLSPANNPRPNVNVNSTDDQVTPSGKQEPKIRYKKSKSINFSAQSVEGGVSRPETSLITAGEDSTSNGLLRIRQHFLDKYAADTGETVK
jgi:hypothetical protein